MTLLEASAGTGKTFAIAALVARLVAEGVPPAQLLVVTFTRMATGELRERVRDRLVTAELGLARALAGVAPPADDRVLELLADGSDAEVAARRRRLADAVSGFDAATIATTHGFCQHVLAGLGVAGDVERDVTFVEDLSDLVEEVVDDLYVRRFHRVARPPFDRAEALRIGRAAVGNPLARLEPVERRPGDEAQTWAMRRRLAEAVRDEVESRKRRSGVMTYDDLLTRLRNTLADEEHGAAACAKLREQYRVALVDEFQDTDPIQWEIMRRAFGEGEATLILIGDPKQAVYSFRGADVYAYLSAADSAVTKATLATNWRSDQGLIDALDALFDGAQLGHEGIVHRPVRAAEANREPRLVDAPVTAPLRVRVLHRADALVPLTAKGYASKPAAEALIADDLAADVVRVLSSSATLVARAADGSDDRREPVRPRHVAVLVPTNRLAALVDDALERAGVPAVINGAGSVFATPAADEWLRLLEAVERPVSSAARSVGRAHLLPRLERGADGRRRRAGLGGAAREVAPLGRPPPQPRRRGAARLDLGDRGGPAAGPRAAGRRAPADRPRTRRPAAAHRRDRAAARRLLADVLAAAAHRRRRPGQRRRGSRAAARLRRRGGPGADHPSQQGPRVPDRLPPVRLAARLHRPGRAAGLSRRPERRRLDDRRRRQDGPDIARHRRLRDREQRGEDLRLLYVALTRTMHQATVWWASSYESRNSSLGRLLFARDADGVVAAEGTHTPDDDEVVARLEALAAQAPGRIAVERVEAPAGARWAGEPRPSRRARREHVRAHARRALATGLVQRHRLRRAGAAGGDGARGRRRRRRAACHRCDGGRGARRATPRSSACARHRLPLAAMPGGADVGDLLHRVLEATDFASADLDAELAARLAEQRRRRDVDIGDTDTAIAGLAGAIETPLGPLLDEMRLRDVAAADRLDELGFELPLVGGDSADGHARPERPRLAARDAPSRRRPAGRLRRPPARPAHPLGPARLPDRERSTSSSAPAPRTARPATPSSTTRATGSAPTERSSAPGTTGPPRSQRRCSARTTRCKPCSTSPRCTATCAGGSPTTTRTGTSPASSTCSFAG